MTTRPTELEERVTRIAGRSSAGQSLVVCALLGKAGIAKTLTSLTDEELDLMLVVAREWDRDNTDEHDPAVHELYKWADHGRDLRVARGAEA